MGRNDVLIADAARLYIADGATVADVTYGRGGFWKQVDTTRFNLKPTDRLTGVDFTDLPYPNESVDVVVLDPPYIYNPKGGVKPSISDVYRANESQASTATTNGVIDLYEGGISEAERVLRSRGLLLVKCQDGIESGEPRWNHITLAHVGLTLGFAMRDLFVLVQCSTPTIRWPHQLHARKNHSYLWVMEKAC
jgi:tRNA G10  N-methylase Trm11